MDEQPAAGQDLAILTESLYLINLMLAPGLAFLGIAWLWFKRRKTAPALARCHLDQTFFVSLWGGVLIVGANAALFLIFGWDWEWTWVFVIMYFTCIHSTLILLGMVGLSKAMAGKPYVYPWIGPGC
jgi:hypothetical protein